MLAINFISPEGAGDPYDHLPFKVTMELKKVTYD